MGRLRFLMVTLAVAGAFLAGSWHGQRSTATAEAQTGARRVTHYVCPMHPQYTSDRPGTAPCCGMRLEPVYSDGHAGGSPNGDTAPPPGSLQIPHERQQLVGIRTAVVERSSGRHLIRFLGRVAAEETRTFRVSAAVDGWIRDVQPYATGSLVSKDQPLATFYSKEFLPAQQNYFYALNNLDRLRKSEFAAAEQINLTNVQVWSNEDTLEGLGMSQAQLQEIAQTRKYSRNIVIRSPATGFLLARNVSAGQRFQRGEELFRIADLSRVWIYADVFENEARFIRPGQPVEVRYQGRTFPARVSRDLPQFDPGTRTMKLRLEADNPDYVLRPDMFVNVEYPVVAPPAITVPVDAVLDSGLRQTVFVERGEGVFEPRVIETGARYGGRVEVMRGLEPGERIVVAGNFLLDSESRMRLAASEAQTKPAPQKPATEKDPVCGMDVDPAKTKFKSEFRGKTYFFCSGPCKQSFDKNPASYVK